MRSEVGIIKLHILLTKETKEVRMLFDNQIARKWITRNKFRANDNRYVIPLRQADR